MVFFPASLFPVPQRKISKEISNSLPFIESLRILPTGEGMEEYLQLFVKETSFYNQIVLGSLLPQSLWNPLPHVLQTWLRNYIGGVLLYLLSGGLWALYIYYWKRNLYLPKGILFLLLLWILDLVFPSFLRSDSSVWIWICPI